MDERAVSLIFLLMAGVLPLRGLTAKWAGRPERRYAIRAIWVIYVLAAVMAGAALLLTGRDQGLSPPNTGPEQLALREAAASGISAG